MKLDMYQAYERFAADGANICSERAKIVQQALRDNVQESLLRQWEVVDGASYFLLPERRIATKTKFGEITLGRVVFQSRLGHEDTDGGKSRAHGTAQCLSHESFVVHLGIADVALLLAEAALLAGLPFSSVVGRGCSSKSIPSVLRGIAISLFRVF